MAFVKRIFLFLAVNMIVILTISFILRLLNIQPFFSSYGIDYTALLAFCFVWGMVGSIISLLLSKNMAKWMMGVKIINPSTNIAEYKELLETIERLSKDAGLSYCPEVGIYESKEVNAFATGATKKHSLIALSSTLLQRLDRSEVEAIVGHEISHIANGDMVTMTLIQGIVNAFVMFLARALAFTISGLGRDRNRSSSFGGYMMLVFLFEIIFMIFGSIIVSAFSRYREYRADAGGARLAGKEKMIQALKSLKSLEELKDAMTAKPAFQVLKISSPLKRGLVKLFATHPLIEKRIERLEQNF